MENNKPYKGEDGSWYEADGTPYKVKKGEQAPWLKDNDFAARPSDINKKGPRKSIGNIIDDMKRADEAGEGVARLDKRTLLELYGILFNTPAKQLEKLMKREDTPIGVSIIIDTLLNRKTRAKAWHDYQQWVYGKAPEAGELNKVKSDIDFENLSAEEKKAVMILMKTNADEYKGTGT